MARIDFKWQEPSLNGYDHVNPQDFRTALPGNAGTSNQPFIVFLTSDLPEHSQEMLNIDSSVLKNESVSIGATLFTQIKLDGAKIKESNAYWPILGGKELPRMIVVDANGAKVGSVEGKDISTSKVYGFMKKAASRTFKSDLDAVVKGTKTILTEIDQVEAKRSALETKKKASSNDKAAEWAKEEKELDEQMKAIVARETELKQKWAEEKKVTKA